MSTQANATARIDDAIAQSILETRTVHLADLTQAEVGAWVGNGAYIFPGLLLTQRLGQAKVSPSRC